MVSPMKFGREPVGSPTKIALVSRSIAVAVLHRGEHLVDRMPVHAQHPRSDHLAVGLGGRGHEQALAEPVELDRQAQLRILVALARQDERVPVAQWPQQPHHAGQDLGVRQAGHILGEPGHRGVELGLRYLAERRIRPPLDLTGEERQVGAPPLVTGHACRVDDAEHLAHGEHAAGPRAEEPSPYARFANRSG